MIAVFVSLYSMERVGFTYVVNPKLPPGPPVHKELSQCVSGDQWPASVSQAAVG